MSCKHQTLPKGHYCCFCGEMLITVCELFISNGTTPCVPRCKLCKDWGESKKCEEKNVEDPCDCSSCLYGRESAKKLITETHAVEHGIHCIRCDGDNPQALKPNCYISSSCDKCKPEQPNVYKGDMKSIINQYIDATKDQEEPKPECEHHYEDFHKAKDGLYRCIKCNALPEPKEPEKCEHKNMVYSYGRDGCSGKKNYEDKQYCDDCKKEFPLNDYRYITKAEDREFRKELLDFLTDNMAFSKRRKARIEALRSKFL